MNSDDEFAQMRQNADLKEYYEMTGPDYASSNTTDYRALAQQLAQALDRASDYVTHGIHESAATQKLVESDQTLCSSALRAARKAGLIP